MGWEGGHSGVIPTGSSGNIHFIALWEEIEYTIQYVLDGGDNAAANPITYTISRDEIILINPSKNGSTFLHWTDANGEIVASIPKGSYGNLVLTAIWELPLI